MKKKIGFIGLAVLAMSGCLTPSQVQAVFTDAQVGCETLVLATSVIPAGTLVSVVASDIQVACNIVVGLIPDIEAIVQSFESGQAAAGVAPSGQYVPSPLVVKARAHNTVKL